MINLLPPQIQEQIRYAKLNRRLLRYTLWLTVVLGVLTAILFTSQWYASRQMNNLTSLLEDKKTDVAKFSEIEKKASRLQTDITAVEKLLETQTAFSLILADIASVLPQGSHITSIGLSTDITKPVKVVVVVGSFDAGGIVRNALLASERIEAVDVQNITQNSEGGSYTVNLILAFNKDSD
jgi:Tfp pilus assembly protein PilN